MKRTLVLLVLLVTFPAAAADWWLGGGGGGGLLLPTALATSQTVTNCYNAAYSNGAAAAEITLTLCPAKAGMDVWVVWEDDTLNFNIDPNTNGASPDDRINAPYTDALGDKLTWTGPGITNSSIHFYSPADGEWTVLQMVGTQATDTN